MIKYLMTLVFVTVEIIHGYSYQDANGYKVTISDITIVTVR